MRAVLLRPRRFQRSEAPIFMQEQPLPLEPGKCCVVFNKSNCSQTTEEAGALRAGENFLMRWAVRHPGQLGHFSGQWVGGVA